MRRLEMEGATPIVNEAGSPEHVVTIERLVYGGDALARLQGKVVLAPFALPDERVRLALKPGRAGVARAGVAEVLESSPHRVAPRCPVFGRCGGCHYQHADYGFQLDQKVEILRDVFRRVAKWEPGDIDVIHGPEWYYRNRIQLHFSGGQPGFHQAGSHSLVAIESCPVASPRLNEAVAVLRRMCASPRWPRFLRSLEMFTNESEVQLNVLDSGAQRVNRRFFEWAEESLPGALASALTYQAAGESFRVSHRSFFQINRFLIEPLVEAATAGADGQWAVDLYAGVGLFSLPLARRFPRVVAVESSSSAVSDLIANSTSAGLPVETVHSPAQPFLEQCAAAGHPPPDFLLADPPRSGLGPTVTAALARLKPRRIHICSCDPPTLARDLPALLSAGYRNESITLVDLFPHSSHLEVIVRLRLN